jgi:hypothetical protein
MLTLWDLGRDGRDDILSSVFVVPTPGIETTHVEFTDGSATFEFEADLHSAAPLRTATGYEAYTLDWSAVEVDASGHEYDVLQGDRLLVGHVASDDVTEVEAGFVRLTEEADALYRMDVRNATSAGLGAALDAGGAPFPGFTTGGTWLVGVECTLCTSPAPLILARVEVVEGG